MRKPSFAVGDLIFFVVVLGALVAFVASELQLVSPLSENPIEWFEHDTAGLLNLAAVGILGFAVPSALARRVPASLVLTVPGFLGSMGDLEELGIYRTDWIQTFYEVAYPKAFPYGFLIFVIVAVLLTAGLVVARPMPVERVSRMLFLGAFGLNFSVAFVEFATLGRSLGRARQVQPVSVPFLLCATVTGCFLIYRMWAVMPRGSARMTPGQAVWKLFIPFYNMYWAFQVIPGFATDYNALLDRAAIDLPRLPKPLFTWYLALSLALSIPIVFLTLAAPVLGLLAMLTIAVTGWATFDRICDGVNALAAREVAQPSEAAVPVPVPA